MSHCFEKHGQEKTFKNLADVMVVGATGSSNAVFLAVSRKKAIEDDLDSRVTGGKCTVTLCQELHF